MANLEGGGDKDTNLKGGGDEEGEGPDPGSGNVQRKPAGRVKPSFLVKMVYTISSCDNVIMMFMIMMTNGH